jgi:hypothetical protein
MISISNQCAVKILTWRKIMLGSECVEIRVIAFGHSI